MSKILKTAIESVNDVKTLLDQADVSSNVGLTGEIRLINLKLNSSFEDIVIFCNGSGSSQITENIIHINIHVPNLKNQPSGVPNSVDNTQPNTERMEEIGKAIMNVVDNYHGFDFKIELETTGEVIPNGSKWYYNIVLRYYYLRRDQN